MRQSGKKKLTQMKSTSAIDFETIPLKFAPAFQEAQACLEMGEDDRAIFSITLHDVVNLTHEFHQLLPCGLGMRDCLSSDRDLGVTNVWGGNWGLLKTKADLADVLETACPCEHLGVGCRVERFTSEPRQELFAFILVLGGILRDIVQHLVSSLGPAVRHGTKFLGLDI